MEQHTDSDGLGDGLYTEWCTSVAIGGMPPDGAFSISAESGTYRITGMEASIVKPPSIFAEAGSYTITGSDVSFLADCILDAEAGSYLITGTDAGLNAGLMVPAEAGSYMITGTAADLLKTSVLAADAGSYTITGMSASIGTDAMLNAEAGSYSITGSDASLLLGRVVDLAAGSYSITGTDTGLFIGFTASAEAGSYAITGTAASPLFGRVASAEAGSYAITGSDVVLDSSQFEWANYTTIRQRNDFMVADEMLSDGAMTLGGGGAVWDSFAVKTGVPLSITASYKTSDTGGTNCIASVSDINDTEDYLFIGTFGGTTQTGAVYKGSAFESVCVGGGDTSDGGDHFMGAAFTSSNIRCWVDGGSGVDESHSQSPNTFDTTALGVLRISGFNLVFFTGTVDNVGFWNRALTDDEYTWLYNSNLPRTFKEITESAHGDNPGVSALSAFYSNTEVPGLDRVDGTGNGNDLTQIIGSPGTTFGLDQLPEYTTTGSYVRTIDNLQGNGGQFVQNTLLNRPSWQTIGGDDVLHFPGVDDNMKASAAGGASSQPNTIFLVCKIEDKGADQKLCDGSESTVEHAIGVDDGNTVMTMDSGTIQEMTLTPDYGNIHVWCAIFDGASSRLYKDGGTADTVPASCGTESWNGVTIGAQYNAVVFNAEAEIYYYVMAGSEFSLTEINAIGEHLADLVGTVWSTAT